MIISPADLELQPESIVQPDVFVVPLNPDAEFDPDNPPAWKNIKRLILVMDLDARVVERWTPGRETPEVLRTSVAWHPAGATTPLNLDLEDFFKRVWTKYRHLPLRFR